MVIATILLGCSFFNFSNTKDKTKSLVDAETYMKELRDLDPKCGARRPLASVF